jgi:hypothetical protein
MRDNNRSCNLYFALHYVTLEVHRLTLHSVDAAYASLIKMTSSNYTMIPHINYTKARGYSAANLGKVGKK